jgi:hypothetical protein
MIPYASISSIVFYETPEGFSINVIPNIRCCAVYLIFYLVGKSFVVMNFIDFMGKGTTNNFD